MNRIIIIGNGFDKAHGLATGYRDFIDSYWINVSGQYSMVINVGLRNSGDQSLTRRLTKMNLSDLKYLETNNIKLQSHHTLNQIQPHTMRFESWLPYSMIVLI
ncbi:hypothetical protein FQN58_06580 [Bacteroides xylanisolvens]|uniref:AbiH family protein n=1 Tax=Bacteroides xylanisolvens TaxID=371601 RepID=UPI001BABA9FA|nr:AbiH family protein [Bacteroides xylanisolvens]QUR42911.1 hypothetical protein FQN58_06580 [Bacteroides xylanisolvens]